ncbi:MAG: transposase [Phormidesmis sp. FL-bin-119]|nr:transposase [Pedobacter sp.]
MCPINAYLIHSVSIWDGPIQKVYGKLIRFYFPKNSHVFSRPQCKRLKICRQDDRCWSATGYCATQKQFYHGYKLHALVGVNGLIDMYDLSSANVYDLHYLNDVRLRKTDCCILGDKAYDARPTQLSLFEQNNIRLLAPPRMSKDR